MVELGENFATRSKIGLNEVVEGMSAGEFLRDDFEVKVVVESAYDMCAGGGSSRVLQELSETRRALWSGVGGIRGEKEGGESEAVEQIVEEVQGLVSVLSGARVSEASWRLVELVRGWRMARAKVAAAVGVQALQAGTVPVGVSAVFVASALQAQIGEAQLRVLATEQAKTARADLLQAVGVGDLETAGRAADTILVLGGSLPVEEANRVLGGSEGSRSGYIHAVVESLDLVLGVESRVLMGYLEEFVVGIGRRAVVLRSLLGEATERVPLLVRLLDEAVEKGLAPVLADIRAAHDPYERLLKTERVVVASQAAVAKVWEVLPGLRVELERLSWSPDLEGCLSWELEGIRGLVGRLAGAANQKPRYVVKGEALAASSAAGLFMYLAVARRAASRAKELGYSRPARDELHLAYLQGASAALETALGETTGVERMCLHLSLFVGARRVLRSFGVVTSFEAAEEQRSKGLAEKASGMALEAVRVAWRARNVEGVRLLGCFEQLRGTSVGEWATGTLLGAHTHDLETEAWQVSSADDAQAVAAYVSAVRGVARRMEVPEVSRRLTRVKKLVSALLVEPEDVPRVLESAGATPEEEAAIKQTRAKF
ncbi:hypothetical protein NEHOM01_2001 [Nematocida homosporus]|uniref:uncharacterized protein n=1 Tax=Nematocida homosporus TaxID=1912981 RepID=UPI00221FDF16|nr:uncharacterized protein NEHOM01_2001 [Nematocida homosporus]KAI5187196.1 hypothetical protein NEHOM01_2001 [Nematocida homosporus]